MREDMASVVTERPRAGGGIQYPKGEKRRYQSTPLDEQPKVEKIRQKWESRYPNNVKEFTDVLGPLYRYLLSQVGQPWNDTWSELCKKLPGTSLNTRHVRNHIHDFVEVHTIMIDGKVCYGEGYGHGMPITGSSRYEQMYVHPETGILCKIAQDARRRWKDKNPVGIDVPGQTMQQYHEIDDVWYIVTLKQCPADANTWRYRVFDRAYKCLFGRNELKEKYGKLFYGVSKRQLNTKEIDRAGLRKKAA